LDIGSFFLMVLGRPFAFDYWPGVVVGLTSLLLFIGVSALYLRRHGLNRFLVSWVVLGLYSVGEALLSTVGRLPMSMRNAVRPDYALHGIYFVIASIVILGMIDFQAGRRRMTATAIATAFIVGVGLSSITQSPVSLLREQHFELLQGKACIQLLPVLDTPHCSHEVYPWPAQMPERLRAADSLGIMRPGLIHELKPSGDTTFYGEVAFSFQIPEGIHFAGGWAITEHRVTDAVAITGFDEDGDEVVLGVLRGGLERNDVAQLFEDEKFRFSGWGGTIPLDRMRYDPDADNCGLRAYALDTETNELFELPWLENAVLGWCGKIRIWR